MKKEKEVCLALTGLKAEGPNIMLFIQLRALVAVLLHHMDGAVAVREEITLRQEAEEGISPHWFFVITLP